MSNQDILNQLRLFMSSEKEITLQTPCIEFLDSFGFIQLVLQAESIFGITLEDDDLFLGHYIIANGIIDMIKGHMLEGGSGNACCAK